MARFVSLISGLFWFVLGTVTTSVGLLVALTLYPSLWFSGQFYGETVEWLTMQAFLGHVNRGFVEAVLTLLPLLLIVLGVMMLFTAAGAFHYIFFERPRNLSQTLAFNSALLLFVALLLIHFINTMPNWIDYARAQLPADVPAQEAPNTASAPDTTQQVTERPAPFLNIVLPEPRVLLDFYEQQAVPTLELVGVGLLVIIGALTALIYTTAPNPKKEGREA